LASQYGLDPGR